MPNYINLVGDHFPNTEAYVVSGGNPTVYSDIVWVSTSISQSTLDALVEKQKYGSFVLSLSFGDSAGNPVSLKTTTYKRIRSFVFPGNNIISGRSPSKVIITAYMSSATATGTVRIYDTTNKQEIGFCTINTNTEQEYVVSCSNWPTDRSIFEVQGKVSGTPAPTVYVTSLIILG